MTIIIADISDFFGLYCFCGSDIAVLLFITLLLIKLCTASISFIFWFLDRTCTHILAWEGNVAEGQWFWFEGNFGDYEKNKVERLGAEAARPSRVTHRKLTR